MVRTQVQLETRQHSKLKAIARARSTSVSQLVREGVDLVISETDRDRRWRGLMEAVGSCRDVEGATDVAKNHDAYLAEIYSRD